MASTRRFTMIIEECEEGGYFGHCPALRGCFVQAETYEDTVSELRAAIEACIADHIEHGEPVPEDHGAVGRTEQVIVEVYETAAAT